MAWWSNMLPPSERYRMKFAERESPTNVLR
jgi:hypothetical protein